MKNPGKIGIIMNNSVLKPQMISKLSRTSRTLEEVYSKCGQNHKTTDKLFKKKSKDIFQILQRNLFVRQIRIIKQLLGPTELDNPYSSGTLSNADLKYLVIGKEFLAIVYAISYFSPRTISSLMPTIHFNTLWMQNNKKFSSIDRDSR